MWKHFTFYSPGLFCHPSRKCPYNLNLLCSMFTTNAPLPKEQKKACQQNLPDPTSSKGDLLIGLLYPIFTISANGQNSKASWSIVACIHSFIHPSSYAQPVLGCGGSSLSKEAQNSFSPATWSTLCGLYPVAFRGQMGDIGPCFGR